MQLRALWSVEKKIFSLGNFLVFRKELELIAKFHKKKKVTIHFISEKLEFSFPQYINDAFSSEIEFEFTKKKLDEKEYNWPQKQEFFSNETNFTLQKINSLCKNSSLPPFLLWPNEIIQSAKKILKECGGKKLIVCHLKNVNHHREESNAHAQSWRLFFEQTRYCSFILLGSDVVPFGTRGLPHLYLAQKEGVPLAVQLALCGLAQGFIGMASGVSTAAIFSPSPYVIFKHPLHHPEEMDREIGEKDHFDFANSKQKLLRQVDSIENICSAFNQYILAGTEASTFSRAEAAKR